MTISHDWYQNCRDVVLMRFEGDFTWEQAYQSQDQINAMLVGGEAPVAVVIDYPGNALKLMHALANARTLLARRHVRIRKIILVSPAPVTRALGNTFARFTGPVGQLFEVCASFAEAEARLNEAGYMQGR